MKSICIKTNDHILLNCLLNDLNSIELDDLCFSSNQFKHYKNIIIHYKGKNQLLFLSKICSILTYLIIDEYEEILLKKSIFKNYFYFDNNEKNQILNTCFDIISENDDYINNRFQYIYESILEYLKTNKSIILTGFVNFRLQKYFSTLDEIVDDAVNTFIIEKEYLEFISLIKLYINSQNSNCDILHLIYLQNSAMLLDKDKNIIDISDNLYKIKYLSDISFSYNDYILNTLLTLLPKKLYIHLINNYQDEFINTLQLTFENRIQICTDCNMCRIYKTVNQTLLNK